MTDPENEPVLTSAVDIRSASESPVHNQVEYELYRRACAAMVDQRAPRQRAEDTVLLLGTMVLFALAAWWQFGFHTIALTQVVPILVGVILLHEFGHYVAMYLFGYRDLRMFFIPFFGAMVLGQKHAAPAWQQAVVLLSGPLPGIAIGLVLLISGAQGLAGFAAYFLIVINGFNLLPFAPLDGGKLLHLLIVTRRPWSGGVFFVLSGGGMAMVGWLNGSWVLGGIGLILLAGTPFQFMEHRRQFRIRQELIDIPDQFDSLNETHLRDLFRCTRALHPDAIDPHECANAMRSLHEQAVFKPLNATARVSFLSLYISGCVIILWSLSFFFYWGEGDQPGEWSSRRINALLRNELSLKQLSLEQDSHGNHSGTGFTGDGQTWTIQVHQDSNERSLKWTADCDDGRKRIGLLSATESGLIVDQSPR